MPRGNRHHDHDNSILTHQFGGSCGPISCPTWYGYCVERCSSIPAASYAPTAGRPNVAHPRLLVAVRGEQAENVGLS